MKGLIWYISKILGREPAKKELSFARREMAFFMRAKYRGVGRFVRKGQKFRRPYREKKELKVGESEVIARGYKIIEDLDENKKS